LEYGFWNTCEGFPYQHDGRGLHADNNPDCRLSIDCGKNPGVKAVSGEAMRRYRVLLDHPARTSLDFRLLAQVEVRPDVWMLERIVLTWKSSTQSEARRRLNFIKVA